MGKGPDSVDAQSRSKGDIDQIDHSVFFVYNFHWIDISFYAEVCESKTVAPKKGAGLQMTTLSKEP